MQVDRIRAQIREAKDVERKTGTLVRAITELSRQNGTRVSALQVGKVIDFVTQYIEHAPDVLEKVAESARRNGTEADIRPLMDAIEEFFLAPDDIIPDQFGLAGLLDDAYLVYTLLQSFANEYKTQSGESLWPIEADAANLFIRNLIGRPFVSLLDQHVSKVIDGLKGSRDMGKLLDTLAQAELSSVPAWIWGASGVSDMTGVTAPGAR